MRVRNPCEISVCDILIHFCRYFKKIPYVTTIFWSYLATKMEQMIQISNHTGIRILHSCILSYCFLHLELLLDFGYFKIQDIFPLQYVLNIYFMLLGFFIQRMLLYSNPQCLTGLQLLKAGTLSNKPLIVLATVASGNWHFFTKAS